MKNNKQKKNVLCPMDIINTDKNTTDINAMVADYASVKLGGKLNLVQNKPVKAKAMQHQTVCKSIEDFHKEHPEMPMYAIMSCGISAGAYKHSEFKKGYKQFNAEQCETILEMAKLYNEAMGVKGKPSDVTYRLVTKFYKTVSHDIKDFKARLATASQMDGKRGHFNDLCANLGMVV